jgi:hypothetical protein
MCEHVAFHPGLHAALVCRAERLAALLATSDGSCPEPCRERLDTERQRIAAGLLAAGESTRVSACVRGSGRARKAVGAALRLVHRFR